MELLIIEDESIRGIAALALRKIGKPAVAPLKAMMGEGDEHKRRCAGMTLYMMDSIGAEAILNHYTEEEEAKK